MILPTFAEEREPGWYREKANRGACPSHGSDRFKSRARGCQKNDFERAHLWMIFIIFDTVYVYIYTYTVTSH